jgi:hypothetical protein
VRLRATAGDGDSVEGTPDAPFLHAHDRRRSGSAVSRSATSRHATSMATPARSWPPDVPTRWRVGPGPQRARPWTHSRMVGPGESLVIWPKPTSRPVTRPRGDVPLSGGVSRHRAGQWV